jgi:cytochrome c oxidase cbb3-type subunit 1
MLFWWSLLVFTGIVLFLQGVLDRVKFGSVLVAHSHLAMAGFLTSLNMVLLLNLSQSGARKPEGLSEPLPFYLWQTGLLGQILSLVSIGYTEVQNGGHSGLGAPDSLPFKVRLAAGILMTAASIRWLTTLSPSNPGVPIQKGAV